MAGLTRQEIYSVVYDYLGVEQGYLADFSYGTHKEFYPRYCGLDIDPLKLKDMTTRARFIQILEEATPEDQAKILRGVLRKYPSSADDERRTEKRALEIGRMIARLEATSPIVSPSPKITSAVVERAIGDAEALIESSGATSGVDRIHTALHGYLLAVCDTSGITYVGDPNLTQLFALLRQQHPDLQANGARAEDITKILRAMGAILDALNPVRNRASVAHPNANLLDEHEAMLVINVAKTLLHYLDAKLR